MREVLALAAVVAITPILAGAASLTLDATVYVPGTPVTVRFSAPPGISEQAWIGLIPSRIPHGDEAVNDENDVDYQYLEGKSTGTVTLTVPSEPGAWDARLNDGEGHELASVSFTVKTVDVRDASLTVSPGAVAPGADVTAAFKAPAGMPEDAWLGVVPSSVPHGDGETVDQHDEGYEYLQGRTSGSWTFSAPISEGSWDVRMIDAGHNGREIASATFEVRRSGAGASLRLDRTTVPAGQELKVHFSTPPGLARDAWVGIIPSSVPHGDGEVNDQHDVDYQYLEGRTRGDLTFHAPVEPGAYDLRLNDAGHNGREIASTSFTVTGEMTSDEMAATLASAGKLAVYGIHFATDSAAITPESRPALEQVGQLLTRDPGLKLVVEGHTDSTGDPTHNQELSERRAASVKQYLVESFGVDAGRLATRGLGATQPVASNDTASGRALNRRVELVRQ